jgi:hypothetical protein
MWGGGGQDMLHVREIIGTYGRGLGTGGWRERAHGGRDCTVSRGYAWVVGGSKETDTNMDPQIRIHTKMSWIRNTAWKYNSHPQVQFISSRRQTRIRIINHSSK